MKTYLILLLTLIVAIAVSGCSGGDNSPVHPPESDDALGISNTPPQDVPETTSGEPRSPQTEYGGQRIPLGFYHAIADPVAGTLDVAQLRIAQKHLNAIPLLETGVEQLVGLAGPPVFSNGGKQLDVDIRVTHPNPDPIFTGFDVHGIFITEGSMSTFVPDIVVTGLDDTRLLNPDGLTRWWNPKEFLNPGLYGYKPGTMGTDIPGYQAATLNGYKLFADGLSTDSELTDLDPDNRGMLSAGSHCTRHYTISLETGLVFNYAVDASWAFPTSVPPTPPDGFPLKANMAEPYWISIAETYNNLWHSGDDYGGMAVYEIIIHDWQDEDTIGPVQIDIPQISHSNPVITLDDQGPGYKLFHYTLLMPELQSDTDLLVLISVDSTQGTYQTGLTGVDKPLRAYMNHVTEVSDDPSMNLPPIALAEATTPPDIESGESVTFDASLSADFDGVISTYEWDFDGDGEYGDDFDEGTLIYPTKYYNLSGTFDVDLRVVDNNNTEDFLDTPITVVVSNQPPTAVAEIMADPPYYINTFYEFSAGNSFDIDGTISTYEWDVNYDGMTFNPTDETETVTHYWPSAGTHDIMLRVTDNWNAEDFLDEPLQISLEFVGNVPPIFQYIEMSRTTTLKASEDEAITLTCYALDLDIGDVLTYEWSCDEGYFLTEDENVAVWVSPDVVSHQWVHCKITDDDDEWDEGDSDMIRVTQYPTADTGLTQAPEALMWELETIFDTTTYSLADYTGNVVYMNFWQTS